MSAISSLYGSPSPSMLSRDPAGIDPNGIDDSVKLEPTGSMASESVEPFAMMAAMEPPEERATLKIDVARLVGAPPPPPKTPPPKKLRRRGNTPRNSAAAGHTPKATEAPATFDYDIPTTQAEDHVEVVPGPVTPTDHGQQTVLMGNLAQSPDSVKIDSPPRDASKSGADVFQERVNAAKALYEREDLALENIEQPELQDVRPAMMALENKQVVENAPTPKLPSPKVNMQPSSPAPIASSPMSKVADSPSSAATRAHSNKGEDPLPQGPSVTPVDEEPKKQEPSPRRARNFSLERKSKKETEGKKGKEHKRGFFKKLFRGRSKKSDDSSKEPVPEPEPTEPEAISPRADPSPRSLPFEDELDVLPLKPALKSVSERQYQGPTLDRMDDPSVATEETPVVDAPPVPVSESPVGAEGSPAHAESVRSPLAFSQDPPDDVHGDPPEFSGRPLLSPTSRDVRGESVEDESRMESVRSRIADLYGEHAHTADPKGDHGPLTEVPSSLSEDRQQFIFQHDDVSGLSGTFGSRSFDPSSNDTKASDNSVAENMETGQVGASILDIPSSTKAHDGEPLPISTDDTVDPYSSAFLSPESLPTPANASRLRVQVHGASVDPAGASPMKWDYRGHPVLKKGFEDPVGESPLHAMQAAPDNAAKSTPRHVDHSPEEKKDDDLYPADEEMKMSLGRAPIPPRAQAGSKATKAALKLAKVNTTEVLKEQLNQIPTPRDSENLTIVVGSTAVSEESDVGAVDVEKSGFKSASSTPVAGQKPLTVTGAAFTNAKAVAYFHRLEGSPSPRHSWHVSKSKKAEPSPLSVKARRKMSKKMADHASKNVPKKPSPSEYGAHNFDPSLVSEDPESNTEQEITAPTNEATAVVEAPIELHTVQAKEGALFSAYNSKFQGRKPSKKGAVKPDSPKNKEEPLEAPVMKVESPRLSEDDKKHLYFDVEVRPGKITSLAVAKGIELRRIKRDDDVANGRSARVICTPRARPEGRNRFNFFPADESEIKDPIQRAGRRILSKSAIPIQCAMRRYLARKEAINRMWALMVVQSYFRRWRCETNLQASVHSAVKIQTAFRGWLARDRVKDMHYSATQIQKIIRGYLVQAHVYDTMYYIVRIQALMKGCYERKMQMKRQAASLEIQRVLRGHIARRTAMRAKAVVPIQAAFRAYKCRQVFSVARASAAMIQATWRSYAARTAFQYQVVDIIITQSVVRRWVACRRVRHLKDLEMYGPASIIQARWRGCLGRAYYKKSCAARKIQSAWRGFQCYTDYIFALVDVLVVQRTMRQWLAKKRVQRIRQENAAVRIQASWRRCNAQRALVYSLVNIIVVQSVCRRFLSKGIVTKQHAIVAAKRKDDDRKHAAATAIQRVWRGFWSYSHYIILQYEITRLQAVVRGRQARQSYNLQLGCAIIIQATMRRHLARKVLANKLVEGALVQSQCMELRERNAAKKIQFWWRIVLDWTKEKKAALTIERFFIHVRDEVDREICRRERRRLIKKERRRQKRRESDDMMLEKAWLNTVDENIAVGFTTSEDGSRSQSVPRSAQTPIRATSHRTPSSGMPPQRMPSPKYASSPRNGNVGQEVDVHGWPIMQVDSTKSHTRPPTDSVRMATSEDHSEVSNITNPSVFNRTHGGQKEKQRLSTEDYIRKYGKGGGIKTTPNRNGQPQHFFADDTSSASGLRTVPSANHTTTPRSVPGTPTRRRSNGGTTPKHSYVSTTPRNSALDYNTVKSTTPRHIPVASPRIHVGIPPAATPRSQKRSMMKQQPGISRRETAETESHTTYSQGSFSKSSPLSRADGHVVRHSSSPVMLMKSQPDYSRTQSIDEAQEVMYLGAGNYGQEYGEV